MKNVTRINDMIVQHVNLIGRLDSECLQEPSKHTKKKVKKATELRNELLASKASLEVIKKHYLKFCNVEDKTCDGCRHAECDGGDLFCAKDKNTKIIHLTDKACCKWYKKR